MNDIVKQEPTEPSQLMTLKPEKYVLEVFAPFKKLLTKAVKESNGVTYDITTTAGMKQATELRATFRKIRLDAEKARKERKAPILEIGKLLDTKYKALESEISPHEDKYDADIKVEEQRKEDEKQRKIAEERTRVEAIENRIANIKSVPLQHMNSNSSSIISAINQWSEAVLEPVEFEEHLEDAIAAVNGTLVELGKLRDQAIAKEREALRVEAERAELEKLRKESAERAANEQRKEAEDRARHEAALEAERAQMAKERAAMDAHMAEQRAAFGREQAARDAERAEFENAAERGRMAMSEIQAIRHQLLIAETGRAPYIKGGTAQDVEKVLKQTEDWPITEESFGVLVGSAQVVKDATISGLKEMLAKYQAAEAEAKRLADIMAQQAAEDKALAEANAAKEAVSIQPANAYPFPAGAPVVPKQTPKKPTETEIVDALSAHFNVPEFEVVNWLLELDTQALEDTKAQLMTETA